jgi:hypothetical protein
MCVPLPIPVSQTRSSLSNMPWALTQHVCSHCLCNRSSCCSHLGKPSQTPKSLLCASLLTGTSPESHILVIHLLSTYPFDLDCTLHQESVHFICCGWGRIQSEVEPTCVCWFELSISAKPGFLFKLCQGTDWK